MIEYNKWIEIKSNDVIFYKYDLENGDSVVYSMNDEVGLVDLFCIYTKKEDIRYTEELMSLNMLYIASGEDTEMLRALMKMTYQEHIGEISPIGKWYD